jgi:hypothetical protein|tara:strand:+ start:1546 stop:1755 length:210 start_codon:yes stop_codon:yes gene_type:complete
MKEGNILSFRILIDKSGNLVTELSGLPEREAHKVFKGDDLILIRKVIREGLLKLDKVHLYLENELDALR